MDNEKILVTGAGGQLGSVLVGALKNKYGVESVIASDLREIPNYEGIFEQLDVANKSRLENIVKTYNITQIYHLAAILSAKGEQNPLLTWDINMKTWFNVLEVSVSEKVDRVFYPSSIAVYGDMASKLYASQNDVLNPATVYGISKASGENWGQYYFLKYGLDVRSLRYPGIIGHQSLPGGGTTDYAVEIYHKAVKEESFECYLKPETMLPMLYMDDAVRATLELMDAPKEAISIRTSYNLQGISFSPDEIVASIKKYYPNFKVDYSPDFRQNIAENWPASIDDGFARKDWGWQPKFDLEAMSLDMIEHLKHKYLTTH